MAERLVQLLKYVPLADRLGQAGHDRVLECFLLTRGLRDYLALFNSLKGANSSEVGAE